MDSKRVVIYARKSTPQEVEADEKSVTRQIKGGHKWAGEHGWTVVRVYLDEGVSGRLVKKRPQWQALLADAATGAFEGVIFFDLDRFGRNGRHVTEALNRLVDLDITVIDYSTGRPIDLNTFEGRIATQLTAEFAEQQARTIGKHIRGALHDKASRGLVASGRCYGYTNLRIAKGHVERRVNDAEAPVVRRIYSEFASGRPVFQITTGLNDDGVPPPRPPKAQPEDAEPPKRRRGGPGWVGQTVREMLHRSIYTTGQVVYGRTRKLWGRDLPKELREREVAQVSTERKDWLSVARPELAIIEPAVAAAVEARLAEEAKRLAEARVRRPRCKPESGVGKYLGTGGLLVCRTCGGHYEVADKRFYACSTHRRKGNGSCTNTLRLPVASTDAILLDAFEEEVLNPRLIDQLVTMVGDGGLDPRPRWEQDRTRLLGERENLVRFIAKGVLTEEQATKELERIKTDLARIEVDLARTQVARPNRTRLRAALEKRTAEWRAVLRSEPEVARTLIRRLVGPLAVCDEDVYPDWTRVPGGLPAATTAKAVGTIETDIRTAAMLEGLPGVPTVQGDCSLSRTGCASASPRRGSRARSRRPRRRSAPRGCRGAGRTSSSG